MNWRGHLIIAADAVDHLILRHRFRRVCEIVGRSSWWDHVPPSESPDYGAESEGL